MGISFLLKWPVIWGYFRESAIIDLLIKLTSAPVKSGVQPKAIASNGIHCAQNSRPFRSRNFGHVARRTGVALPRQPRKRQRLHLHWIDAMSYQYLVGAEIDYSDGLEGAQFVIKNPNATSSCGCGNSCRAEVCAVNG